MSQQDFIAPQNKAIVPEEFQLELIGNIATVLLKDMRQPCLLKAPTGAGKTFIITQVLQTVTQQSKTIWFWFVPFANLMQQTEDEISSQALNLSPMLLERGRNQLPQSGMVVISTSAAVGRRSSRIVDYTDGHSDDNNSMDHMVTLAKAAGLKIGLVVDEAHIGLDSQTEFGKFANWLEADRVILASATAKDQRMNDFIVKAGFSAQEVFTVSRHSVVNARLNKRYVEAVIYAVRQSIQGIADLQMTVLRQSWTRNKAIGKILAEEGIALKPLLLVQVGSGANAIETARKGLIEHCGVHPSMIGEHSAEEPDHVLMTSIANDETKEVLIFKQSAGTGFNAPRAFVLASTKHVNDPDFATQFLGRIMRVHRAIRSKYARRMRIPQALDTAYIYLANSEAQRGFEQAVISAAEIKDDLEGQTEKFFTRETANGGVHISNKATDEPPLFYDNPFPESNPNLLVFKSPNEEEQQTNDQSTMDSSPYEDGLFANAGFEELDLPQPTKSDRRRQAQKPTTKVELISILQEHNIKAYPRRAELKKSPKALMSEERPEMDDMAEVSKSAATRLNITDEQFTTTVSMVLGRAVEKEIHKELTDDSEAVIQNAKIIVNKNAIYKEARERIKKFPQVEDEDAAIIIDVLSKRSMPFVNHAHSHLDEDNMPDAQALKQIARLCAYLLIRKHGDDLEELLHEEIAAQARETEAEKLPDFMLFPASMPLDFSLKNLFGVYPPSKIDVANISRCMGIDDIDLMHSKKIALLEGTLSLAEFDASHAMGTEEREFSEALDQADFVVWWHRNPDRKPYSARLVRGEHRNYFYPDFIVCLEHFPGDEPLARLIETKESTKDAARKSRHASKLYGRVLFLTKYNNSMRIVQDDGSLGASVDMDNLRTVREWLRSSKQSAKSALVI
jgi:type III restriction enzyme